LTLVEPTSIDQVNQAMRDAGQGEVQVYRDKPWHRGCVPAAELRFTYEECRGLSVDKGRRVCDVVAKEWRELIAAGDLPASDSTFGPDVLAGFTASLELVVLRDVRRGLYVMDGCKRVASACFHGEPADLWAFVVDTGEEREVWED
jgi:hypothetical protein